MYFNHILNWLQQMGITDFCAEEPHPFATKSTPGNTAAPTQSGEISLLPWAEEQAQNATSVTDIYTALSHFTAHPLHKTALHTLCGKGTLNPTLLCITDTPTAEADKTNNLTAGKEGELFEKMMTGIHLSLNQNCFLIPFIPWRPPGNRPPTSDEINLCLPFIMRQIDLINPKCILLMGAVPTTALLPPHTLSQARGTRHTLTTQERAYPCFATFSPAAVWAQYETYRPKAWEDFKKLRSFLETLS